MKFTTASGSTYEVDSANSKVRRLTGISNPTERQGNDGEWKKYTDIIGPFLNKPCMIVWDIVLEKVDFANILSPIMKTTITSEVVSLEEDNQLS